MPKELTSVLLGTLLIAVGVVALLHAKEVRPMGTP
jgi:hypothetical protein